MIDEILRSSTTNPVEIPNCNSPVGQFIALFSHPWHFIQKRTGESSWSTESRYPIAAANLWHCWKDESTIVGIRFGEMTRYAVIDIDRHSLYHPANDPAALPQIKQALETIGIYRTILVRSSESEGLHLYCPLSESVPTFRLAQAIAYALKSASLQIAAGTLEVFPNAKRYNVDRPNNYNGHRLPLQKGSFLLNSDFQPVTNDLTFFLDALEMASSGNDITELVNSFTIAEEHARKSNFTKAGEPKGSRGKLWKLDCERVIEMGWTAYHQTNQVLGVIAQYGRVFKGLADQALEKFVLQTAIACPGYGEFCRHQKEIEQRCRDWAHSAQKAYTPYVGDRSGNAWKEQKERKSNAYNESQSADALDRIKQAIEELRDRAFDSIREWLNAIAQVARCSIATLYKHRSLWVGCNSQNHLLEGDTGIAQKVIEKDTESLEPAPSGLLHPNSVYEGVGILKPPLSAQNFKLQPPEIEFKADQSPNRAPTNDLNPLKPP